ncbi:MAG: PKD domain-containing protein [Catenulispora sp.]|nr:PKD domain-containing protein [Catenulispora sp.]
MRGRRGQRRRPGRMVAALAVALAAAVSVPGGAARAAAASVSAPALVCTAPTAQLVMHPASGQAPLTVTADASASTPGSCPIGGYTFDWGDGTPTTGPQGAATASHSYPDVGSYTVTVTVTDDELLLPASSTAQAGVTVVPVVIGPTAALRVTPPAGSAPLPVTADASGSRPGTFPIAAYTFAWGDGSTTGPQSGGTAHHVYPNPGKYTVTVTVADNQTPAHTASATFAVNVGLGAGPTPSLILTPATGVAPLAVTLDASGSVAGTSAIASYAFDFGDGTGIGAQSDSRVRHTYPNAGSYTATVLVTDRSGLTSSTTAELTVLPGGPGGGHNGPLVHRVAGADRIATGVAVSQLRWDPVSNTAPGARHAGAAVLARSDQFADALAGIPLAVADNAPLLLTGPTALDERVEAELARILPAHGQVYLLGGTAALSPQVEARLRRDGYHTVRLAGADRFATALAIAQQGLGDPAHVVVATGDDFPDALAAGPYAASAFAVNGQPAAILLSDDGTMPPAVAAYVTRKAAGSTNADPAVVAIGGPGALALAATLPADRFDALVGADRFDTAARVVPYFARTAPVGVADGDAFPDALTGGTLMAELSAPVVLAEPDYLDPPTARALHTMKGSTELAYVFGGPVAISDRTLGAVAAAVDGRVG